jgi:hypothetical protein
MCRNGEYTERGIKAIDGYASELWCVEPGYAVKLDERLARVGVLMEPASVVAKAWEQLERIGAACSPRCSASSAAWTCTSSTSPRPDRSRRR